MICVNSLIWLWESASRGEIASQLRTTLRAISWSGAGEGAGRISVQVGSIAGRGSSSDIGVTVAPAPGAAGRLMPVAGKRPPDAAQQAFLLLQQQPHGCL